MLSKERVIFFQKVKKYPYDSQVISYFNYCSIVSHFGSLINIHNTEKLHDQAIRFIYNDYETDYFQILMKNNLCTLYVDGLRGMCCEIYKVKKGISSAFTLS